MPVSKKYLADFKDNCIYHVYNRTNDFEKLFLSDRNRDFFLERYNKYLSLFVDTYCWSLLPNHFHFLVRIKDRKKILEGIKATEGRALTATEKGYIEGNISTGELVSRSFKRFFQSYSLSFNKVTRRRGNLFCRQFKRIVVDTASHFTEALVYIHANPMKHGIADNFMIYEWSSWKTLLSDQPTALLRDEVIGWFGNKKLFIRAHHDLAKYYSTSDVSIED